MHPLFNQIAGCSTSYSFANRAGHFDGQRSKLDSMSVMMGDSYADSQREQFLPGDVVKVLSEREILATLDENGTFEKLPFMPEMLDFCGRTFRVSRQAFKTCVNDTEIRGLDNTVFLKEVRCDGTNHGGCARSCLIFWKTAWLKRVDSPASAPIPLKPKVSRADLLSIAHQNGQFFCQSTEILNASKPLPWWEPRQYLWDLTYNRTSLIHWLQSLFVTFYNKIAFILKLNSWRFVAGPGSKTLTEPLHLQPGEMVRVKSLEQIRETLDENGKHNNLQFAPTMIGFCGQVLKVRDRVENINVEGSTRQRKINDTVLLEDATCDGVCHRLCPRQSFLFWRECWLERV
jgi:hypothetical protein